MHLMSVNNDRKDNYNFPLFVETVIWNSTIPSLSTCKNLTIRTSTTLSQKRGILKKDKVTNLPTLG